MQSGILMSEGGWLFSTDVTEWFVTFSNSLWTRHVGRFIKIYEDS